MKILLIVLSGLVFLNFECNDKSQRRHKWTLEQAQQWQNINGWSCGANYIPSSAINQLEMWQAETFDTATINRELGWAENIGMNVMRVYLHHLAWEQDPKGFKKRINAFLDIASRHQIKIMFVFFDDCWNPKPKIGMQPKPVPGKHNSGWVQDPGQDIINDTTLYPLLESYVKDVMNTFAKDKRILIWDLYNEPNKPDNLSMPLLQKVFQWSKETEAEQPVTSAIWDWKLKDYNTFQLNNSDIISYHNYGDSIWHKSMIDSLKKFNRPIICSEYMARKMKSTFMSILPILKREKIIAINWGLVSGKTNTIYAWDDTTCKDGSEPKLWFHDIFYKNGTPYKNEETELIKQLTKTK